jgi:hypothetical protein|tara:strand:+ start:3247 stop:3558 length:312 start_codon:yes stop_codon:yes gene_type:complete
MLENLLNSISSNPAYLAVAIVLMAMITFSVIKRLFKLVTLGLTLFIIYCAYLIFTDQPLPDLDNIKSQSQEIEKSVSSMIQDNVLEPLQEKTDVIKDNLNNLK